MLPLLVQVLSGFFGPGPIMPPMHCGVEGLSLDQPKQLSPARTSVVTDDEADEEPWLVATLRSLWSQTTKSELLTRLRTEFAIFTCVSEGCARSTRLPTNAHRPFQARARSLSLPRHFHPTL